LEVVASDDEAEQLQVRMGDGPCEVVDQALPALFIVDDVLPGITPRHDVVDGAVKFDAKSSWHFGMLTRAVPAWKEKPKTKADTHQKTKADTHQRLTPTKG
jgi:hypothetical protein